MNETNTVFPLQIVFGAFPINSLQDEETEELYNVLKDNGINRIDTARVYEDNERTIGERGWSKKFIVDTKAPGFGDIKQDSESLNAAIQESLSLLKLSSVEVYYLHCPDLTTPLEEVLSTIDEFYNQGKFKIFGISNFPPALVRKAYDIATKNGYVLPTVYQGNYNAFARKNEEDLFPLLQELGIAFYAYSPVAGGFLTTTSKAIAEGNSVRFKEGTLIGNIYRSLYATEPLLRALDQFNEISEKNKIEGYELAYRWIFHDSALDPTNGDGVILGGRNAEQIKKTLDAIKKGPLPRKVVSDVNRIWSDIKEVAPRDNWEILQLNKS